MTRAERRALKLYGSKSVDTLELSFGAVYRVINCRNLKTINDLVRLTIDDLRQGRRIGCVPYRRDENEIVACLADLGLRLGMIAPRTAKTSKP